jgi:uncharacterized protein (DUF4415 family)
MKKVNSKALTSAHQRIAEKLAVMRDEDIDLSDVPEQRDWKGAKRGVFYKPIKQQLTLRSGADVVDWFKQQGEGYQSRINAVLRAHVERKVG